MSLLSWCFSVNTHLIAPRFLQITSISPSAYQEVHHPLIYLTEPVPTIIAAIPPPGEEWCFLGKYWPLAPLHKTKTCGQSGTSVVIVKRRCNRYAREIVWSKTVPEVQQIRESVLDLGWDWKCYTRRINAAITNVHPPLKSLCNQRSEGIWGDKY